MYVFLERNGHRLSCLWWLCLRVREGWHATAFFSRELRSLRRLRRRYRETYLVGRQVHVQYVYLYCICCGLGLWCYVAWVGCLQKHVSYLHGHHETLHSIVFCSVGVFIVLLLSRKLLEKISSSTIFSIVGAFLSRVQQW